MRELETTHRMEHRTLRSLLDVERLQSQKITARMPAVTLAGLLQPDAAPTPIATEPTAPVGPPLSRPLVIAISCVTTTLIGLLIIALV